MLEGEFIYLLIIFDVETCCNSICFVMHFCAGHQRMLQYETYGPCRMPAVTLYTD